MKCRHGIDERTCWFCLGNPPTEPQDELHEWEIGIWLADPDPAEEMLRQPPVKTRVPLRAVELRSIIEQAPRTLAGSGAGFANSGSPAAAHAA